MSKQVELEKPQATAATSKRLLQLLLQQRQKFLVILTSALCFALLMAVTPLLLGWGLDQLIHLIKTGTTNELLTVLKAPLFALLGCWLAISLFSFLQENTMASVSETLTLTLRKELTAKLNRLPMQFYDTYKTGDLLTRATLDLDKVSEVLQVGLMQLITAVFSIAIGFGLMLFISPWLTAGILVLLVGSSLLTRFLAAKNQHYFAENQRTLGAVGAQAEEYFTGNLLIKTFNQQEQVKAKMAALNDAQYEAFKKAQFVSYAINPLIRLVNQLGFVVSAVVGGNLVLQGNLTIGVLQAYLQYVNQVSEPITQAAYVINSLQSALAALERIFEILDLPEEKQEAAQPLPDLKGEVRFQHVAFAYQADKPLMTDVSFTAQPQQTVAVVGPTGAGKTTLINLLMRFYEVTGGQILLDGQDTRQFSRADLRRHFGMVLQDTWLFEGTVAENIAYGKPAAIRSEIVTAAKKAQCDHFIRTLPQGYDTVISGDGTAISQGQQQLLTIARAILADPQLLILDEATSSVDTRTEKLIQRAMAQLTQARTSFVIAHRLSTIENADLILVMQNGDIIEQGTHQELMQKQSFYANLYNSQFAV
ncbi:ABC transporter ATP-binding protein [Enterococcus canis]|nr:ABC transporter ATP-binding protein [Enterococcus canis]